MITVKSKHNNYSKELFQKVLLYIDTIFINVSASDQAESAKILTEGLLNVRDALFSDIVKDNFADSLSSAIENHENKKKLEEENQKDLNQEKELEKDQ